MRTQSKTALTHVVPQSERFIHHHILGLRPDPERWPEPSDAAALPLPEGIDHADATGAAWVLDREFESAWHRRRTAVGAQAYRFTRTGEYDCGWRLVDCADRFLRARGLGGAIDIVTIVPPPPVYTKVPVPGWPAERLAHHLEASYTPALFEPVAPVGRHADLIRRLPVALSKLYQSAHTGDVAGRGILLVDWRWRRGRTITILARQLKHAGAGVARFAWVP